MITGVAFPPASRRESPRFPQGFPGVIHGVVRVVPVLIVCLALFAGFSRAYSTLWARLKSTMGATPAAATAVVLPTPTPALSATNTDQIDELGLDVAEQRTIDVYQRLSPSVVNITTQVLQRDFFFNVVPEEGAGSGFVLDREGRILTNYHVVNGAQRIEVNFDDETVLPATVIGADSRNDLAVLKVAAPADLLVPVDLGESSTLRVGQRAIAIGNPFGQFGRTLTTGVISALNRTLEGGDSRLITGVIQTDASINRGNSGGPLLDSSGRVIGINSAIFSPTGASAGVGFAIPVDTIKRVLPDLISLGYYRRPWLGVRYGYSITPGLAQLLNLPAQQGVLLVQMLRGSPLLEAEIRGAQEQQIVGNQLVYVGGDILLALDQRSVTSVEQLDTLLEDNYRVGDTVTLDLLRNGESLQVQVKLAEEPN